MPTLACAVVMHLWLRHLFSSFPLDRKGPKGQGRHQGPTALGDRSSPMSAGPARPTRLVFGKPCPIDGHETLLHLYYASPNSLIADPHSANAERDLLRPWDSLLVVALRHREARSDPFMIDLRKIYFQKKIHFISNYLPDNKRLQSTTNVCSTA